jgi:uncharacterized lipoprotein YmbA
LIYGCTTADIVSYIGIKRLECTYIGAAVIISDWRLGGEKAKGPIAQRLRLRPIPESRADMLE